jgi:PAS domain S-box-containing protein
MQTAQTPSVIDRVRERFGMVPNFFRLAADAPEITEKLWGFAETAYLDNPLPSLFKERLFVRLSRFCTVRYCIARHVGFLTGLGCPSGDAQTRPLLVEDVIRLLQQNLPRDRELELRLSLCANCPSPILEMPVADSQVENAIFALAGHVFLQTDAAPACLDALERLLGAIRFQYFLLFLTFVRAAHYWTKVHPELVLEDDIKKLLETHEALAACVLNDPEAGYDSLTQSLGDELPSLRLRGDKAIGLLAAIVDSSDDAIVSKTLEGVITSWNKGAERLFGYSADEAIGNHISLIIPPNRIDEETTILQEIGRGRRVEHFDTVRVAKDGTKRDVSLTISPIRDRAGKIVGASKIAHDVTGRKQADRALRDSKEHYRTLADALDTQVQFRTQELQRRNSQILRQAEQLRGLSGRLLRTQDEERRHIARELHDSAGQTLAALCLHLGQLAEDAERDPTQLAKGIHAAEKLVQNLSQELRTTSYLLHPPLLDECGLTSALRWYVQGLTERSGLDVDLSIPDDFERFAPDMEVALFRLVQECLTNIHRHSGCKTAIIRFSHEEGKIRVSVQDHGKGMSPEQLSEIQSHSAGVGIMGMRERLRPFGGELAIESDDSGTRISAVLPSRVQSESGD